MRNPDREPRQSNLHWDVASVRKDFPTLVYRDAGRPATYLDGPAGSQLPACVLEALERPGPAHALANAQAAFADWLGGAPDEIAVGPSMTSLARQAARVLAPRWRPGDNIVLTRQDHCANTEAWRLAADARRIEVRWVDLDASGSLDLADLDRKVTTRTRLVAFSAASNVTGTINDVQRIVSMVRGTCGAMTFVDAVHLAAHRLGDAGQWGCDFATCSAYKFYGPKVAALWIRGAVRDSLNEHARREPAGTLPLGLPESIPLAMLSGVQVAIDYLAGKAEGSSRRQRLEQTVSSFAMHERRLISRLWQGLNGIPRVRILGLAPTAERTATTAFSLEGIAAQSLCELLSRQGIRVGCGHFNAVPLVQALGYDTTGVMRAGCMMYTAPDEVDRLLEAVTEAGKRAKTPGSGDPAPR